MSEPKPVQTFQLDQLAVRVYANRRDMGIAAGRAVARQLAVLLASQARVRLILAAAPSQNETLAELAAQPGLDWPRTIAFHMDEYLGLGREAPQSFGRYLAAHLFDLVKPGVVHYLDGLSPDAEAECRRYTALLNAAPIDLVCAGIGENGHLAFNDPPVADFDDPRTVKVVPLTLRSREQQVHDGCFPTLDAVPTRALTLTVPALWHAANIHCMVPGPTKAEAVRATLRDPISTVCPATILRRHRAAVLYLDRDSAALL